MEWITSELRLSDISPALRVPKATPTSSDEEERRESRDSRFRIPPNEDVEQTLIPAAVDESRAIHTMDLSVKECKQADAEGVKRTTTCGRLYGISSPKVSRHSKMSCPWAVTKLQLRMWSYWPLEATVSRGNWVIVKKARTPQHAQHAHKTVAKLCPYLLRHVKSISHGNEGGVATALRQDHISWTH